MSPVSRYLRDPGYHFSPSNGTMLDKSVFPGLTLTLEILSGQHIPRPQGDEDGEIIDPYVEVKIRGHQDDFNNPDNKQETEAVRNNGFNPTWRKKFTFTINLPDLAFLELKVTKDISLRRSTISQIIFFR